MLHIRRHGRWAALAIAPVLAAGIAWAGTTAGQTKAKPAQESAACPMGQHGQSAHHGPTADRPGKAAAACPMGKAECEKQMHAGDCPTMMGGKAASGCAMMAGPQPQPAQGQAQRPTAPAAPAGGGNHPPGCPMAPGK